MEKARAVPQQAWSAKSPAVRPVDHVDAPPSSLSATRVRSRCDGARRWARRLGVALHALWHFAQVDYHSHYSLEKAVYLLHFRQTTWSRWKRLLLTPWGCLVASLLSELLPLEDPARGWRACPHFLIRLFLRTTAFNAGVAVITQEAISEMALPPLQLMLLSVFQAHAFTGCLVLYADIFQVFPVPFAFFVVVPAYFIVLWASLVLFARKVLLDKHDPETQRTRARFVKLVRLNGTGPVVLLVYAAYATLFNRVDDPTQLALAALLQVLKVFSKHVMWTRAQISPGGDDLAGEHVTASAHFFHALFTATSMQSSKSSLTLVLLVGWNLAYDVFAIRSLLAKRATIERLWHRVPETQRSRGKAQTMRRATRLLAESSDAGPLEFAVMSSYKRHHVEAQRVLLAHATADGFSERSSATSDDKPARVSDTERAWLRELTLFFHWRETVLLRMYVDIFVPCIYLFFVAAVATLPNREYYPFMRFVSVSSLLHRVAVQVGCKVGMLATMLLLLHHERRQRQRQQQQKTQQHHPDDEPTALEHLGFVVHAHRVTFQCKLLIIGLTVLDFPLTHLGNDVTFQFDWIRNKRP